MEKGFKIKPERGGCQLPKKSGLGKEKTTAKVLMAALEKLGKNPLVGLAADLYSISRQNREFIETRLSLNADPLKPFKSIILDALNDDITNQHPISISRAKKAISDYRKASGDRDGELELMVLFVERGNFLTVEYGDFGEPFYDSMVGMYRKVVERVKAGGAGLIGRYEERLRKIMESSKDIGYGYHDDLKYIYHSAFSDGKP
jgi:hypothetical protein